MKSGITWNISAFRGYPIESGLIFLFPGSVFVRNAMGKRVNGFSKTKS